MLKPKLILTTMLSATAIVTSILKGEVSANSSVSSSQAIAVKQQSVSISTTTWAGIVGIGFVAGLGIGVFYKKRRNRLAPPKRHIDRFQEEFLCGPLANYYLSKSETSDSSCVSTPTKKEISQVNTAPQPTPLFDRYQALIEEIVATALKGQIRSKEYIYKTLVKNVTKGTSEIFERVLSDRQNSTQSELDNLSYGQSLFQKEDPELKKAHLTRTLKALQSIQGEWDRVQKYNRTQTAIQTAVQQIISANYCDRFTALLRTLDANRDQVFSLNQLQQLAQELKASSETSDNAELKQELQQFATGLNRGVESCHQLETYLVRWMYEPTARGEFRLNNSQRHLQEPWASWERQVNSRLAQQLFYTLAEGCSVVELVARLTDLDLPEWVELAVILKSLQGGLIAWFEKQPYDSKWGIAASISTYLNFAGIWCQLSNGFDFATSIEVDKRQRIAQGCFEILLQTLRTFAHRPYFPLYGGVFASFGGEYLQNTLNYLNQPLRQIEGTQEKARILTLLGYSQRILGNYTQAESFHQQALEISRQARDWSCEIANLNHLGRICVAQKNYSMAIDYSQRALILARQAGDRLGEAHALATLGYSEVFSAQQFERVDPDVYENAIAYLKQGLVLSERLSEDPLGSNFTARHSQALCCNSLGIAHVALEKPHIAIEFLEKGIEAALCSGDRYLQGFNFMYLAEAYYKLKNIEKTVCNSCLGMYLLEQISAKEWRQSAGLLVIVQGKIGVDKLQEILVQGRSYIISVIGIDGYDHLPKLLQRYQQL